MAQWMQREAWSLTWSVKWMPKVRCCSMCGVDVWVDGGVGIEAAFCCCVHVNISIVCDIETV